MHLIRAQHKVTEKAEMYQVHEIGAKVSNVHSNECRCPLRLGKDDGSQGILREWKLYN